MKEIKSKVTDFVTKWNNDKEWVAELKEL